MLLNNEEKLDLRHFNDNSIDRTAKIINYQWSTSTPTFVLTKIHKDQLWDKTFFLNLFSVVVNEFVKLKIGSALESAWIKY